MPNLNRVMLMGNLTRDPELRYTPNNTAVANFGLAINRQWRTQEGDKQEETTFVDCEAWSRRAEVLNQYLRKGRPLYVEGHLRLDQWQDKDGNKRSRLKVVVDSFEFIDSRSGDQAGAPSGPAQGRDSGSDNQDPPPDRPVLAAKNAKPASQLEPQPHEPVDDQDIPF